MEAILMQLCRVVRRAARRNDVALIRNNSTQKAVNKSGTVELAVVIENYLEYANIIAYFC